MRQSVLDLKTTGIPSTRRRRYSPSVSPTKTAGPRKRRYPRVGLPKGPLVAWQWAGERVVSRVGTMGLGGLFISTPEPPPVGEIVRLFFEVPGGEVRARAVVRDSVAGQGMGIEFTSMDQDDRARLHELLRKLLG